MAFCKVLPMTCKELVDHIFDNNLEDSDIPVFIVAQCARTHNDIKEGVATGATLENDGYVNFTNTDTESYYEYNGKAFFIYGSIS